MNSAKGDHCSTRKASSVDGVQAQTGGPQCADRGEPGGPGATGAPELTVSAYPLSQAAAQAELPDDVPAPERLLRPLAGLPKDPEWRHFAETISRVNGYMLLPLLVPFTVRLLFSSRICPC